MNAGAFFDAVRTYTLTANDIPAVVDKLFEFSKFNTYIKWYVLLCAIFAFIYEQAASIIDGEPPNPIPTFVKTFFVMILLIYMKDIWGFFADKSKDLFSVFGDPQKITDMAGMLYPESKIKSFIIRVMVGLNPYKLFEWLGMLYAGVSFYFIKTIRYYFLFLLYISAFIMIPLWLIPPYRDRLDVWAKTTIQVYLWPLVSVIVFLITKIIFFILNVAAFNLFDPKSKLLAPVEIITVIFTHAIMVSAVPLLASLLFGGINLYGLIRFGSVVQTGLMYSMAKKAPVKAMLGALKLAFKF
mgnify:CR=1 FL=1